MKYICIIFLLFYLSSAQTLEESLILETREAIDKSLNYLLQHQNEDHSWGKYGGNPALTALIVIAFSNNKLDNIYKGMIQKAANYIANFCQGNGAIYDLLKPRYINYSTSLGLLALFLVDEKKYGKVCLKARRFLKSNQFSNKYNYGGIGYGSDSTISDLSNTQFALEALYLTQSIEKEISNENTTTDLCWNRAKLFLSRCQKISTNRMKWVAKNHYNEDNGGAIYSPTTSKAIGKNASLRTYGSMTYALLKSMVYAGLKENDIRVSAILSWVSRNYTVDENPNLDQQGYYYYLNMFTKALHVSQQDYIVTKDGILHNWRNDVINKILSLQKGEGYWKNPEGRWQESNPLLVTAYTIISLRYALGKYN